MMNKSFSTFLFLMVLAIAGFSQSVAIGSQEWTNKNLNVSTFRNGEKIPQATTEAEWTKANDKGQPAWCFYNFDPGMEAIYGKLYNWYAVNDSRGLAPIGWHIPSDQEWNALAAFLGGELVAGNKLKSQEGWDWDPDGEGEEGISYNSSGFSGLPGGYALFGKFYEGGENGFWWTSTLENTSFAWNRRLYFSDGAIFRNFEFQEAGMSVRCIRD